MYLFNTPVSVPAALTTRCPPHHTTRPGSENLMPLQFWITLVLGLGMLETTVLFAQYLSWNDYGAPALAVTFVALFFGVLKVCETVSYSTLLFQTPPLLDVISKIPSPIPHVIDSVIASRHCLSCPSMHLSIPYCIVFAFLSFLFFFILIPILIVINSYSFYFSFCRTIIKSHSRERCPESWCCSSLWDMGSFVPPWGHK